MDNGSIGGGHFMGKWRSRWIGICLIVCLNGCVNPAPLISPEPAAAATSERDEIQNSLERQMVILFQGLVEMLPLVVVNTGKGQLKQTDQSLIINLLTPEQKDFFDDFQERLRAKEQDIKEFKKKAPLSVEEREAMIHEFELRRREKDAERHAQGEGRNPNEMYPGPPSPPPGGGFGNPKNVEQQLIELLEAKIRKSNSSDR
jgi:hypothetical protein